MFILLCDPGFVLCVKKQSTKCWILAKWSLASQKLICCIWRHQLGLGSLTPPTPLHMKVSMTRSLVCFHQVLSEFNKFNWLFKSKMLIFLSHFHVEILLKWREIKTVYSKFRITQETEFLYRRFKVNLFSFCLTFSFCCFLNLFISLSFLFFSLFFFYQFFWIIWVLCRQTIERKNIIVIS